ncbi:MAG: LVIVD repeat-containing protein [Planctomycetota bacterium]
MLRPHSLLACAILAALTNVVSAQDHNVTKLSRTDDYAQYNDVWGYVAPDGREYALLGEHTGTVIYNVTDPVEPYEVAYIPGPACIWRDMKSYGHYVYSVNDCLSGVQVIDMINPEQPVLVNEFGFSSLQHAHNIYIDEQTGRLYACGTSQGMAIYNLAANPVNPPLLKTWNGQGLSGVNGYVHDVYVRDGRAHPAMIYDGLYVILNVSNLPSTSIISSVETGEEFTHSTWTTADGSIAVTADEKSGSRNLQLWDISNAGSPELLSSLAQGNNNTPHNPYILGDVCHVSYYDVGYVAYDISDPVDPVEIGRFDTTKGTDPPALFFGAWGCYPFAPSGVVYVSDINNGLYLFRLNQDFPQDPSGLPAVCDTWPTSLAPATQLTDRVLVEGSNFTGATAVHLGALALGPADFTVLDDQVLTFQRPAVLPDVGLLAVTVQGPAGTSDPFQLPLLRPGAPILASGPKAVSVGGTITHSLQSDPGDLQFLAFSALPQVSLAPGKAAFDIGAGFTNFWMLSPFAAGPSGVTNLPPFTVPAAAAGLTAYWQYAVIDQAGTKPAPTSNVSIHVIGL